MKIKILTLQHNEINQNIATFPNKINLRERRNKGPIQIQKINVMKIKQ